MSKSRESKMSTIKIIRLLALAVALIAAFVTFPYATLIMIILGLAIGFMGVPEDRRLMYMVTAITLTSVVGALGPIPAIGDYLTAILTNTSTIINAGAVSVIVMIIWDRIAE